MNKNPPHRFSRRKTVLFTAVIMAGLFGMAEFTSYVLIKNFAKTGPFAERRIENRFSVISGWEPTPNVTADTTKAASPHPTEIQVDDEGNSITPLSWDKPDLRIVFTGGSTMFGVGASGNATTVPSLLEKKIHSRLGLKAEVINLAVRAGRPAARSATGRAR